jgi:hypothetical protein
VDGVIVSENLLPFSFCGERIGYDKRAGRDMFFGSRYIAEAHGMLVLSELSNSLNMVYIIAQSGQH